LVEKRQPLQQMFLGKQDIWLQKTETRSLSFTLWIKDLILDLKLEASVGKSREIHWN
jgi:hypothetical protein